MLINTHHEDAQGNVFTLRENLKIFWRDRSFTVPEGFESDGASVPRFFWRAVFPPGDNRALQAAFAHDYLYRTHPDGWTKLEADHMFYELLIDGGIPCFRALLAYLGVRFFGAKAWEAGGK